MHIFNICVVVFTLLSSYLIVPVSATYRSRLKHYRENFDPAEADPRRNITCIGSAGGIELPILDNGFNPNGLSMQELCAKPQYGGGAPYQHAGAYCYGPLGPGDTSDSGNETYEYVNSSSGSSDGSDGENEGNEPGVMLGKIVFDPHRGAKTSSLLQNPRFMQACTYRCFCNYGLEDVSHQPLSRHFPVELWEAEQGYELKIDVENDFIYSLEAKMGDPSRGIVDSIVMGKIPQIDSRGAAYLVHTSHMNLDPENEIECVGSLPNFVFPPPFDRSNFSSNQELCAVTLSGGNKDANAGGYCHRSAAIENTVWFSDSMTPRYDWTWGGGGFFGAASIRYHCWEHCSCKTNPPRDPDTAKIWRFMSALQLRLHDDGSLHMEQSNGGESKEPGQSEDSGWEILPPQQQQGMSRSPSGNCGAQRNEFCPQEWNATSWGPVPVEPPNVTDIVKPSPPKNGSIGVCGNKCTRASDCGTTEHQYSCSCAYPSVSDAHILGLDPVVPVAVCIALFSSAASKNLGGRDLDKHVDARGVPHSCRCNETTVSDSCCITNYVKGLS